MFCSPAAAPTKENNAHDFCSESKGKNEHKQKEGEEEEEGEEEGAGRVLTAVWDARADGNVTQSGRLPTPPDPTPPHPTPPQS